MISEVPETFSRRGSQLLMQTLTPGPNQLFSRARCVRLIMCAHQLSAGWSVDLNNSSNAIKMFKCVCVQGGMQDYKAARNTFSVYHV